MAKYYVSDEKAAEVVARVSPWPDEWYLRYVDDGPRLQWLVETDNDPATAGFEEIVRELSEPRADWSAVGAR